MTIEDVNVYKVKETTLLRADNAPASASTRIFANENNGIYTIPITEGCKIWMPSKEICLEIEKKLNSFGVKTRSGCTCGIDWWSIYIISVPENLINTEVEL